MKFTFISKMTAKIKRFFIVLYQSTIRLTSMLGSKVYQVSDEYIKFMFSRPSKTKKKPGASSNAKVKKIRKYKKKATLWLFIGITCTIVLIAHSVFIVPVSDSAVVLRLGKFKREAKPGLNIRFPFIERYYIVNTGNVLQETFGFMQVVPPIFTNRASQEEQDFVKKYERNLKKDSVDKGGVLSEEGNVLEEVQKKQPLTKQYLVEKLNSKFNLTIKSAKKRLRRENKKIKEIIKSGSSLNGRVPVEKETRYITADLNIIRIGWALQYKIVNPRNYLFNSKDVQNNIKNISLAMMNKVVGHTYFSDIVTDKRKEVEKEVAKEIQKTFSSFHLGITVTNVIIIDALPVKQVEPAFNEINKAAQEMENTIYAAQKLYLSTIPQARGEAERIISEAKARALLIVNKAKGEAGKFSLLLKEYRLAPKITKQRLYLEAMDEIFQSVPTTIIDKKVDSMLPIFMGTVSPKESIKKFDAANSVPNTKSNKTSQGQAEIFSREKKLAKEIVQ